MVTVIIPALNEENTIAAVIALCLEEPLVSEVIVVDDNSSDNTAAIAASAGAKVIASRRRGKGISMRDGIAVAANPLLVFLDADIHPYPPQTISRLVQPLMAGESDFVKGAFARNAGRVTELVAKPLLKIFFPELASFQQPLSGMIAGRKALLSKIDFFTGYGVDVGILIDMFLMQARVKEVNIGYIENKSKPWQMLSKMSSEVSDAIIRKAALRQSNFNNTGDAGTVQVPAGNTDNAVKAATTAFRKMVVFDMDNTLLKGRFIDTCAQKFFFTEALEKLRQTEKDGAVLTKRVAGLLKGISMGGLLQAAAAIPVVHDAEEVIAALKQQGYVVGIISDSYQVVVDFIKNKVGADFAMGNRLEFFAGMATGEVIIPSWFYNSEHSCCKHAICKSNALTRIAERYGIHISNIITVGDGLNDLCMISQAGLGIAFCTAEPAVRASADKVIDNDSFASLLKLDTTRQESNSFFITPIDGFAN